MTTESHNFAALQAAIIARSLSDDWAGAKLEWSFVGVEEEPNNCLCGKDIFENCIIVNVLTKETAIVGNVCINRFLGLQTKLIFTGLQRIRGNPRRAANAALIVFMSERGVLNTWETEFLLDTRRKRNLSEKQEAKREALNRRMLSHASARKHT